MTSRILVPMWLLLLLLLSCAIGPSSSQSLSSSSFTPNTVFGGGQPQVPVGYSVMYNNFTSPNDLVTDSLGFIYVADTGDTVRRVLKLSPSGLGPALVTYNLPSTPRTPGPDIPCGLCLDSAVNVYVVDYVRGLVVKFNNDGVQQLVIGTSPTIIPPLSDPSSCKVDSAGFIYIANVGGGGHQQGGLQRHTSRRIQQLFS